MSVQINVAANQAALTASIQAGVQAYNQRFAQNNQLNLTINPRAFSQPLGRITGDVKDFEAALAASNARVIAFGASTAVLGGVIRSFKELANVTIEVEKNLADINRVFGLTTSQLQKFSTDLFNVTKQTASSFNDASQAALEFSRQGLKAEETLQRTKDALTLTRLAGISTANAVDALTSTVNGFAATGITTSQILNKLVAVEQDFAVGAGDLAEALSRTGQAAQEAGVSLDQLNALVTSAQQSTARGGAVIGNALKTIFTRLQRTDTLDQLEAFNISVRDVQGNILPAVTILQNFAGAYQNLADAQRAQLSEQVAGVYQVNILKAIVNDLNKSQGVYAGALQRGAMATNEAEVATAKLNQTLDALLKQTATSTQQLANNIGKVTFEPLARYGTEQLKSLVESMNEILEGEGIGSTFANGLLKGIRNILAGPGAIAAFFTLFKLIQNSFTYLSQALPQIAGITTETQNRKNIEQSILQIMAQQGPVAQALAGTMGNQAAQAQLLLQVARQQTAEYQTQTALARQLAAQLAGQGVRVRGSGGLQVTRAGGYIPASTKLAEVVGAQAGGYSPGRVVPSPVGGVMNTAEDVKYIPGFAQPFINPPARSKAGRAHRQNAINRTGIDPYMASGFIPNFVKGVDLGERGKEFEKLINFHLINEKTSAGSNLLDFALPSNALTKASFKDKNKISLNPLSFYGDAKIKSTKETQKDLIKKLVGSLDEITYGKLITRANKIKSNVINLNDFLPVKPSLISSKSSITKDNENASVESVLGFDVIEKLQRLMKNDATQRLTGDAWENKKLKLSFIDDYVTIPDFSNSGFIPNFAPPTSAIRVPWFKKFGNASFDAIQPTLGISKASDLETFRQINFRSKAKGADKVGDSNIFAPLYEDFVFKALQLVSQPKIKDQLIRGYVLQPGSDQKQSAFDAFVGNVAFEKKGFPKENLPGSISKNLNDKYERFAKANPSEAAKIKESIMIFNEVGHENQLPSDFGKNFTQLAGTSYSQMVKNSPDLVKGLSEETNMLLNRYVKDPAFLAMSSAKGFIPNFGKDILTRFYKTQTGPELFSSKGTGLSGTVYRQPGYKSYGYQLKEQLNNMVMSILGNNVFFPDASSLNPKIYGDVNKGAENFAKNAALRLSSGGKTSSLGLGSGMMNETFGNSRLNLDPEAVYTGQVSGRMKRVNYDRLSDVLGAFWSGNPQTKSAWESLKNLSESGKFEEKESIRAKTSLLKKAYEEFLIKNNYIGTRVKLSSYRKRAEGVEGVNYGSLRSDLAGVSDVRNLGKNNGFVPNFADLDTGARSMLVNSGTIPFVVDLERRRIAESSAADDIFHSEIVNKKFIDPKTKKPIYPKLYKDDIHSAFWKDTFVRGFVDSGTGKVHFDLTTPQKEDKNFIQKYSVLLEQVRNKYAKKFEEAINEIKSTPQRNQQKLSPYQQSIKQLGSGPYPVNHFNNGFIPNFNFIKGRNSFQKNWLIETAKKRNLNLNDPDTFSKLATEFAKTYPNDQGMFGLSKGFIPNFAYKQSVMSLEESMSGNKAVFDTKPFPHIRNSSQPTFSSAISDHGGLGNALSDSMRGQKAAGLMSKGFIPNFTSRTRRRLARNRPSNQPSSSPTPSGTGPTPSPATPTFSNDDIDRAISDFINSIQSAEEKLSFFESAFGRSKLIASETLKLENALKAGGVSGDRLSKAMTEARNQINQQQGKFAKGLSSASTAISLAGPMLAGFAEQALFGNRKRTEMTAFERQSQAVISTGISAVSTGAGIGAAFGPQGALIGAAAGAVVGLVSAIDAAKLSLSELAEIDQELLKKQQASSQAASGYIDNQKKLNDLIASGASSQDIENATRNLSLSFNEIKDVDLAQIFANTGGNVNKLQDELKKYNDELTKKGAGKSALGNLQEGAGFFASVFAGGKTTAELGVKEPSEVAAELFRSSSLFKDTGLISAMKAGTNKDLIASVSRLASNRVDGKAPGLNKNAGQIAIAQKNYAKKFTDELFPDLEANDPARYQQELQRSIDLLFGKSGEAIALGLEKMGKLEASNTAIQKARSAALQGFAEIFGRIERSIRISSLQVAMALEKDSQINRINSAINEFTTNFSESIESFVMNSLPEGPNKLGFTKFTAERKYDDAIAKQQIAAENFRLSQQKERNDYQKSREENITKLFKDVSLQSEQSAKFFESDIYGKVKSGDLSDLSAGKVSTTLTQKLIDQARSLGLNASRETTSLQRVLKEKKIDLSTFNFSDKDNVSQLIETVGAVQNNIAATGGANSNQTDLKDLVAKFQNSLGDLYNTQEFFANKAKKQEYDAAIELARLDGDQFNQRMSNAEKLFQVNQVLERTQLEAAKTLSVDRAKVDNANFMRMESMKNLSASIASNLEVSKAEGTRDINRLKRTLQDPTGVAGLGVSERSERQFKIQDQILKKERANEDANINAEIQQRMLELAAERENTTALYNLSQVIERFAAKTLLKDLGGEQAFKEMQNNPYIGKSNQELDAAQESLKLKTTGQRDRLEEQYKINQARSYSPEQLAKFEAYKRTQASIEASRSGNTPTATVDAFADRMSKANFNKMDRDEQMTFLAEERKEADKAGAVALSNTISRFQEQIKLRKEALDISRQDVNEQVELDKRIIRTNNSFAGRFKTSFNNLKYQGEEIFLKLGEDLPRMFADGLVNGIKAAIRESDNLGEALMGIAGNFLDAISTAMMQSAVYSMLGSMGFNIAGAAGSAPAPKQKGGVIRAQSGMYISGTGSGDKYPALLENGEYVLNRNAVMAMGGPSEIDKLNFSMAPRFASGGSFATELNDIKSMEEGMTTFGLENSKVYNELRDAERAKQAEKRRKAAERKKMIAGLVGSIVGMAASFGIMKVAGGMGGGGNAVSQGPGVDKPVALGYGIGSSNTTALSIGTGGQTGGLFTGKSFKKNSNSLSYGSRLSDTIPAYAEGGLYSSPIVKKYGVGMQNGGMYGGSSNNSNTVTNTNATNSFNFNTTVNRDGTIQMGADSTSYKQQDVELSNNLNSQVYKTVLDVIKQQQRFGGTLAGTRRPI